MLVTICQLSFIHFFIHVVVSVHRAFIGMLSKWGDELGTYLAMLKVALGFSGEKA